MTGADLANAAEALVGVRFLLHGRNPETGLDCIGVLAAALERSGSMVTLPNYYALRTRSLPDLGDISQALGLFPVEGQALVEPGDILFARVGPCQLHLYIAVNGGRFVHAHAGARRVICCDGPIDHPILGHWRFI